MSLSYKQFHSSNQKQRINQIVLIGTVSGYQTQEKDGRQTEL